MRRSFSFSSCCCDYQLTWLYFFSVVLYNQRYGNCQEIGFELFNKFVRNVTFDSNVCIRQNGASPLLLLLLLSSPTALPF